MSHAPVLLNACRCAVAFSLFFCMGAFAASSGALASGKVRLKVPSAVFAVAEPPSFVMLALGLVGIGLHGIARASRR